MTMKTKSLSIFRSLLVLGGLMAIVAGVRADERLVGPVAAPQVNCPAPAVPQPLPMPQNPQAVDFDQWVRQQILDTQKQIMDSHKQVADAAKQHMQAVQQFQQTVRLEMMQAQQQILQRHRELLQQSLQQLRPGQR
jgi:hypothetical protein